MSTSTSSPYSPGAPNPSLAGTDLGHVVRFYSDDTSFLDELTDFVRSVLHSREPVIMVATAEHCQTIREMLTRKGCDLEREPFVLLDAAATLERFMVNDEPDAMRFRDLMLRTLARSRGGYGRNGQRVTIFGEMVAVLWSRGNAKAALQLEELWNDFAQTQRFSLICAYPSRLFEGCDQWGDFANICGTHSTVIPDESYSSLKSDDERLRAIAALQLKARVLEKETARHKTLETSLQSRIQQGSAEIEASQSRLRDLSGQLVRFRDQECQRIAQELHDSTAQLLSVLAMYVDLLEGSKEGFSSGAAQLISRSNTLVKQILLEVRSLSYGLYPPTLDIIGLGSALEWYVTRFTERSGIAVTLEIPSRMERFPQPVELAIFRIIQESLAELLDHECGSSVSLRLSRSAEGAALLLSVTPTPPSQQSTQSGQLDVFRSVPGGIQERVRQLNGRVFTVSDASSTGISVFFPIEPQAEARDTTPSISNAH